MTKDPVACSVNDPVEAVARLMRDKGIGYVVCLREGRVAGCVTDRQLAVNVLAEGLAADTPVDEVMTGSPATVGLHDNVFSVLDTLRSAGVVRRAPVVDEDGLLLGVVSVSDVAVIAKDLIDGILLEETHHAMKEARVLTGGKRVVKEIRRPTKTGRLPPGPPTRPVTEPATAGRQGPDVMPAPAKPWSGEGP